MHTRRVLPHKVFVAQVLEDGDAPGVYREGEKGHVSDLFDNRSGMRIRLCTNSVFVIHREATRVNEKVTAYTQCWIIS
jgi:hypothetical protein